MDNMLSYFEDWKVVGVTIYAKSDTYDQATGKLTSTYATTGATLSGIKYSRSAAERYYSERWQPDVTEVIVAQFNSNVTQTTRLGYGGKMYAVDSVVNVADQGEVMLIGIKEFA